MRPIRLSLQAFGPFATTEVVDFRSALETGLFGIYGQTGAGKSTLFSAMSFALFVNRQPIVTPYRHPKMTPLERPGSWPDAV